MIGKATINVKFNDRIETVIGNTAMGNFLLEFNKDKSVSLINYLLKFGLKFE